MVPNPYAGLLGLGRPHRVFAGLGQHGVGSLRDACAGASCSTRSVHVVACACSSTACCGDGRIRAMDATLAPFDVEPLRETARVAAEVRERLAL